MSSPLSSPSEKMQQAKSPYAIFCDMLRHPSAKPLVARTRNFVERFPSGQSRYDAGDRVHKFLTDAERLMFEDIVVFMAEADEQGRLNAAEGLEKMVMGRLYPKTFAIEASDEEEDATLKKHIDGLSWVEPKHLGIPSFELSLWPLLLEELRQMNAFKCPCDKLTCIVNACHVINDLLKRTQSEIGTSRPLSADDFLPLLIFALIKANPPRLHSNVEFIAAFRHPSRLNGEYAYWMTMVMSAKEFVKQAGPATLDISPEEYARLYEESLSNAAQKEKAEGSAGGQNATGYHKQNPAVAETCQEEMAADRELMSRKEVVVFQIPPVSSVAGQKAHDWDKKIWSGELEIISRKGDLAIRMVEKNGNVFAECLVPRSECDEYVSQVVDSKQHFTLKIMSGQKRAVIGLGFEAMIDAYDFNRVLIEFKKEAAPDLFQRRFSQALVPKTELWEQPAVQAQGSVNEAALSSSSDAVSAVQPAEPLAAPTLEPSSSSSTSVSEGTSPNDLLQNDPSPAQRSEQIVPELAEQESEQQLSADLPDIPAGHEPTAQRADPFPEMGSITEMIPDLFVDRPQCADPFETQIHSFETPLRSMAAAA